MGMKSYTAVTNAWVKKHPAIPNNRLAQSHDLRDRILNALRGSSLSQRDGQDIIDCIKACMAGGPRDEIGPTLLIGEYDGKCP